MKDGNKFSASLGHYFLFFWFTKSADPNFSKTGIKIKLLLLIIIFIFFRRPWSFSHAIKKEDLFPALIFVKKKSAPNVESVSLLS